MYVNLSFTSSLRCVYRLRKPVFYAVWVRSLCPATDTNESEIKSHFRVNHTPQLDPTIVTGCLSDTETEDELEAWLHCDFATSPSQPTGVYSIMSGQAIHQAQPSKALAAIKAKATTNQWTQQEIDRFKRLVQTYGLKGTS